MCAFYWDGVRGMGSSPVQATQAGYWAQLSPLSRPGPALPDCQALPNSQDLLKSHVCAEKGKKADEASLGGG